MGAAWQMWLFLVLIKLVRSELQGQLLDDFLTFRRISNGFIQGRKSISPAGSEGYVFLGIPYTTPPTGSSRFKKTQPPNNWDGELDATKFGKGCLWNTSLSTQTPNVDIISEDCLSINVYSSKHCLVKGNCSVLVYLHGGRLVSGSSSTLKEELIIENFANDDRNVVFVSMNYR
uniref:COesterase domain-containing protein n=1 Tax=Rhabditophanes sp. KR3021 TaxID=114890 RepID=A0AC35TMQ8_9BILA